ncbi:MAG: hypothetical protein HY590_07875, partial [Candidatus Omnitrophica bacterium]|nr:hypothetical protein [Candidatus Omnitrophota bacterium]
MKPSRFVAILIAILLAFGYPPPLFADRSTYEFLKEQAERAEQEATTQFKKLKEREAALRKSLEEVEQIKQGLRDALSRVEKAREEVEKRELNLIKLRKEKEQFKTKIDSLKREIRTFEQKIQEGDERSDARQKLIEAKAQLKIFEGNLNRTEQALQGYEGAFKVRSELELAIRQANSTLPVLEGRLSSNRWQRDAAQKDYDRAAEELQQILTQLAQEAPEEPPFVRTVILKDKGSVIYEAIWHEQTDKENIENEQFQRLERALEGLRSVARQTNSAFAPLAERSNQASTSILKTRAKIREVQGQEMLSSFAIDGLLTIGMAGFWVWVEGGSLLGILLGDFTESAIGTVASEAVDRFWSEEKTQASPTPVRQPVQPSATTGFDPSEQITVILQGTPWREALDSALKTRNLPDSHGIEKISDPKAWGEWRIACGKLVDEMAKDAKPRLTEFISERGLSAGQDTGVTAVRARFETSKPGKALLTHVGEEGGVKLEPIGKRDIAETFVLSFSRELILSYLYDDIYAGLRKSLLEEETYREGLENYFRLTEGTSGLLSELIQEGQKRLLRLEEEWIKRAKGPEDRRMLKTLTDQPAEEEKEYAMEVRFTQPIQVLSVKLGTRVVTGETNPKYPKFWSGKVRFESFDESEKKSGVIPLSIEAKDEVGRLLDANPATPAYRDSKQNLWNAYESDLKGPDTHQGGADQSYRIRITPQPMTFPNPYYNIYIFSYKDATGYHFGRMILKFELNPAGHRKVDLTSDCKLFESDDWEQFKQLDLSHAGYLLDPYGNPGYRIDLTTFADPQFDGVTLKAEIYEAVAGSSARDVNLNLDS